MCKDVLLIKLIKQLHSKITVIFTGFFGCVDKFIKQMSEEEKTELSLKVQENQNMGEEKPSP